MGKKYEQTKNKIIDPRIQRSKIKYEGQIYFNHFGTPYKVIEYIKRDNIIIEFQDEYHIRKQVSLKEMLNGHILNPYDKTICGIGYYGDICINKNADALYDKCYNVWIKMLRRCYDTNVQQTIASSYIGCTVCEEWHNFKCFREWYMSHYYQVDNGEQMCVDKDILFKGNKVYSPQTCCIVPNEINVLFTKTNKKRGEYPIGVYCKKSNHKFVSQCKHGGNKPQQYLGTYDTWEEAFLVYKNYKENYIKQLANKYKYYLEPKVYDALINYQVEIND